MRAQETHGLIKEVRAIPFGKLLDGIKGDARDDIDDADATAWREKMLVSADTGGVNREEQIEEGPYYEMLVPQDKVRFVIGVKGVTIKEIIETSRCRVSVSKDGADDSKMSSVLIAPLRARERLYARPARVGEGEELEELPSGDVQLAVQLIRDSMDERKRTIKEGLFPGVVVRARVEKVMDFGAFVSLPNGKEGLVHISELDHDRVEAVTDCVDLGDELFVVVLSVDERGRTRLSLKDVDQDKGVFLGSLPSEAVSAGGSAELGAEYAVPNLPMRLDDKTLWPSLDETRAATGGERSRAGKTPADEGNQEGRREESKEEWMMRIRQQREKAVQEATAADDAQAQQAQQARQAAARATRAASAAARQQQQQQQPPPQTQRKGQGQVHVRPVREGAGGARLIADQDYRRDIPVVSGVGASALRQQALASAAPQAGGGLGGRGRGDAHAARAPVRSRPSVMRVRGALGVLLLLLV